MLSSIARVSSRASIRASSPISSSAIHRLRRAYSTKPEEGMDDGERAIFSKLQEAFQPSQLQVQDVSGTSLSTLLTLQISPQFSPTIGGCGSFYAISIASKAFAGLTTVKQHRLVNSTLKKEISNIHGLQVGPHKPWRHSWCLTFFAS